MRIINFDKIYSQYNENLLNKLRGFANNDKYLIDWIPSENINESLIDLLKILYEKEKHTKVTINFENEQNYKDVLKFYEEIKDNCKVKIEKKSNLSLTISDINISLFSKFDKKKYSKKIIKKIKYQISKKNIDFLKNIKQKNYKFKFEIDEKKFNSLKEKNIFYENKNYGLILNLKKNLIININFFTKKKTFLNNFLLEKICFYSLGKNIEFLKNDLLNVLEYNLRNSSFKKNIKGIISVYVLINEFFEFNDAILKICENLKVEDIKNEFKQEDEIKLNKELINNKTAIFNKKNKTVIQVIDTNNNSVRVEIKNKEKQFIPKIIFKYDQYLKNTINSKINVYYNEKKDLNKLRIKNLKT